LFNNFLNSGKRLDKKSNNFLICGKYLAKIISPGIPSRNPGVKGIGIMPPIVPRITKIIPNAIWNGGSFIIFLICFIIFLII